MKALSRWITRSDTHKGRPVTEDTNLTALSIANTITGRDRKKGVSKDKGSKLSKPTTSPLTRSDTMSVEEPYEEVKTRDIKVDQESPNKDILLQNKQYRDEDIKWRNEDKRENQEQHRSQKVNKEKTNLVQQQILNELKAIRFILKDGKLSPVKRGGTSTKGEGGIGSGIKGLLGSVISGGITLGLTKAFLKGGIGGVISMGLKMITKPFTTLFSNITKGIAKTKGLISGVINGVSGAIKNTKGVLTSVGSFAGKAVGKTAGKKAGGLFSGITSLGSNIASGVKGVATSAVGKIGAVKGVTKSIGKSGIKKVPILGALAGLGFGAQRLFEGDFKGAGLEVLSGASSMIPGIGTAASLGIDGYLIKRDLDRLNEINQIKESNIINENDRGIIAREYAINESKTINEVNNLRPISDIDRSIIERYYNDVGYNNEYSYNTDNLNNLYNDNDNVEFIRGSHITDGMDTIHKYNQDNSQVVVNNIVTPQQREPSSSTLIEGSGTSGSQAPLILSPNDSVIRTINMQLLAKGMI